MEALRSSEKSFLTRAKRRNILEHGILHCLNAFFLHTQSRNFTDRGYVWWQLSASEWRTLKKFFLSVIPTLQPINLLILLQRIYQSLWNLVFAPWHTKQSEQLTSYAPSFSSTNILDSQILAIINLEVIIIVIVVTSAEEVQTITNTRLISRWYNNSNNNNNNNKQQFPWNNRIVTLDYGHIRPKHLVKKNLMVFSYF
jgi:hypothetical protein